MRKNSRISNPGTKMSPLEADEPSDLRFLSAAYRAKDCELAPT
jgi:hypothetical protein